MDENKFWISVWGICGVVVLGLTYLSTEYWSDHNAKIVDLIGKGVDPVAVMCALQDDYGDHPVCIVLASKGHRTQQ